MSIELEPHRRVSMQTVSSRNSLSDKANHSLEDLQPLTSLGSKSNLQEWKRSLSKPRYKFGPATIHLNIKAVLAILAVIAVILLVYFINAHYTVDAYRLGKSEGYNKAYPMTLPIKLPDGGLKYRIAIISDLDEMSHAEGSKPLWQSYFLKGYFYAYGNGSYGIEFDKTAVKLLSSLSQGGRGMELSELVTFSGNLLAVDDRTGIVYKIIHVDGPEDTTVVPWVILPDGNGDVTKGFKSEWASVKDGILYVGGLGKEWTTPDGHVQNHNPQFVKKITPSGGVTHEDWKSVYDTMKDKAGYISPGYMIHESAAWSDVHRKWFFLPRRASKEQYNDKLDERRATNQLITCDENYQNIQVKKDFGPRSDIRGFSSFKFVPGTNDELIIALKSEEDDGRTASFVCLMDLQGKQLIAETHVGDFKFEGIEFI